MTSVKIVVISDSALEEDFHYYVGFNKELADLIPEEGIKANGVMGGLKNGWSFAAIEIFPEEDLGSAMVDGVWVVIPQVGLQESHIGGWLSLLETDETTKGCFSIAPKESVRANDLGMYFRSACPLEMFQLLLEN